MVLSLDFMSNDMINDPSVNFPEDKTKLEVTVDESGVNEANEGTTDTEPADVPSDNVITGVTVNAESGRYDIE